MRTIECLAAILAVALAAATSAPAAPTDELFEDFSPERMAAMTRGCRPHRLSRERKAAAAEIRRGILFDAEKVLAAIAALTAPAADTAAENVERITRAFTAVDPRLAGPTALAASGEHARAAAAWAALISPDGTTWLDSVKRLARADALRAAGAGEKAAKAYAEIIRLTPRRASFASTAALRGAEVYESIGRRIYAMQLRQWWLDNCAFLDETAAAEIEAKIAATRRDYDNPLLTMAGKMGAVADRLARRDSGRQTQQREKEILAMLNDLIAVLEEQQKSGGSGGGQSSGANGGRGGKSGPASGTGRPSSPATRSTLPGGEAVEPTGLSDVHVSDGGDAWGRLPIRQREKIVETLKQKYPARYTEMLEAYYRRLSEQEQ